jgi:carboxyl-terminal processing protease
MMRQRPIFLLFGSWLVLSAALVCAKPQEVPIADLVPTHVQERTTIVINQALERFHYRKVTLNDDFAEQIFESYLKALDPNRSFFLQLDYDRFARSAHRLDDNLSRGKLDFAFEVFRLYRQQRQRAGPLCPVPVGQGIRLR